MIKRIAFSVVALSFLVLAGLVLRGGSMQVASAHTLAPSVQTPFHAVHKLSTTRQVGPAQGTHANGPAANGPGEDTSDSDESTGSAEDQGQDANLPGGGHQDRGQADHQFEGTE